jgi:hypothetical protein
MDRKMLRIQLPLTMLLASAAFIQSTLVVAFNAHGSPASSLLPHRIGAFLQGSHQKRNHGHDREYHYQHTGMGKIDSKIDNGNTKNVADDEHLRRLERDKYDSSIRPVLEPSEPRTRRDLQIQQAPENDQSVVQHLKEETYSVSLAFSLWLGAASPDKERYGTATSSPSSSSLFNISELENTTNPIHISVVQSLWQLLCTRPDIRLLEEGDIKEDTDTFVSTQQAAVEADACINFLSANGNQRRFQEAEESTSVLRQTPVLAKVELRQVENATTWTEWTTVFQVERVGERYLHLAWQENAAALASASAAAAAVAGDPEGKDDDKSLTRAAAEIMRESLQLLLDIAVLAGPMNQVIQERLKSNFILSSDGTEKSTASATLAIEAISYYTVLCSPVGGELQAFPAGIPNVFSDNMSSSETTASKSRRQPATFDASPLNANRITGLSLFILTIAVYATMLFFSRQQRRWLVQQENGDRVSATGDVSE